MTGAGGGPKGELVQWGSVLIALALLGHNATLVVTGAELDAVLEGGTPDVLHTDYSAIRERGDPTSKWHSARVAALLASPDFKARVGVSDIYGTQAEENAARRPRTKRFFCCLGLPSVRQYLTWIPPEVPDPVNTFLGFAQMPPPAAPRATGAPREALLWGKEVSYFKAPGVASYLKLLASRGYRLTATTSGGAGVPGVNYVGSVSREAYQALLDKSTIFVGLGDPLIGPSPIEAIAHGCVYLNPRCAAGPHRAEAPISCGRPTASHRPRTCMASASRPTPCTPRRCRCWRRARASRTCTLWTSATPPK